jgi:hypothetical protein
MATFAAPPCLFCQRFNRAKDDNTCEAFPAGIPEEIFLGDFDHRQPYPGDNDLRFEPVDQAAIEYADLFFALLAD